MSRSKKSRGARLNDRICESYRLHNDDDISTERLLAMVSDDCDCDVGRVIDGLVAGGVLTKAGES